MKVVSFVYFATSTFFVRRPFSQGILTYFDHTMKQEWMQAEWESMPEATLGVGYIDVCVELEYFDQ